MQRTGVYDASVMSIGGKENVVPERFYVSSNYPNPFNPTTSFYIDVPEAGNLSVSIYDVKGKVVKELINTYVNKGRVQRLGPTNTFRCLPKYNLSKKKY
jgi:hypothetical protein